MRLIINDINPDQLKREILTKFSDLVFGIYLQDDGSFLIDFPIDLTPDQLTAINQIIQNHEPSQIPDKNRMIQELITKLVARGALRQDEVFLLEGILNAS